MSFECGLNIGDIVFKGNTGVPIALTDSLREQIGNPYEFFLASFPYTDKNCSRSNPTT